jgi:hypothetical protein
LCGQDQICVTKNNYVRYSIKDTQNRDVTNLTHTFGTPGNIIAVASVETTKNEKKWITFTLTLWIGRPYQAIL